MDQSLFFTIQMSHFILFVHINNIEYIFDSDLVWLMQLMII